MEKFRAATDSLKEVAIIYFALVLIASVTFMALEERSLADSLYWAGTTATSTGYGDITPRTSTGKFLSVCLMHLSIFIIAPLIVVRLVERLCINRDVFTHEEQQLILDTLARIDRRVESLEKDRQR